MRLRPWLVLLVLLVAPACELRLANDVVIEPDGGGRFELLVAMDQELRELLTEAGADPLLGLDELRSAVPGWDIEEVDEQAGGLALRLRTSFADPDDFARLTDQLHDALDDEDGALWEQLRIRLDGDTISFAGTVGLEVPRFPGADGDISFDEDDLSGLVRERGDEFVRYELRVTMPGDIGANDADEVVGSTLRWELPVGGTRQVTATSQVAVAGTPLVLAAVALVVATGVAVSVVTIRARRRSAGRREHADLSA